MKVVSINVGLPKEIPWQGRMVRTSIFKQPVVGPVMVRRLNIDGDAQSDLAAHGGEHRAVMVYQTESYEYWRRELKRDDLYYGQFGENFTVEGLADKDVCIGDRYRIGTAIFEVTQPRVTCYRVGISLGVPEMPALLVSHKRPGFYFRVIQEGEVAAGDSIEKLSTGPEGMNIADIDQLLYSNSHPKDKLEKVLKIPALSNGWQYSFKELLDAARAGITTGNAGLSGPAGRPLAWQGFRPFVVKNATMESLDICSFQLASQDNAPLPPFQPGQHLAVKIQTGNQGKYLIRMYSICSPQNATTYRIAVKREQYGQASAWLHDHLKEGDVLEASAPRGTFTLLPGEGPVVLLGAGVGITPLLSMLYALQSSNTSRQVWWVYSVRDRHHHCFIEELRQIAADWPALHVVNIYSRPGSSGIKGVDFSCSGHLDADIIQSQKIPINADFYLCGPAQYLDDTTAMLRSLGAEENRIRFETFGLNISSINARPPHLPAKNNGAGPLLTFNKSNISFKWDPRFTSILDAAEACDIPVAWSCRMGVCHRCESALLDGNVQYLTQPLDLPSEGNILICCSIPASPITLDL